MVKQQISPATLPEFPESCWITSSGIPRFPKLTNSISVDVAIVGAGITGITTAYLLSGQGLKVALIDAGLIMNGTTGHTTAKITAQHDLVYSEFIAHFGQEQAKLYYEANREAMQFIRQTVRERQIACDYSEENAYIYTNSDEYVPQLQAEMKAYESLGIPGSYTEQTPLPFGVNAAVMMNDQARFNPVPYLTHLVDQIVKQGGQIYELTAAATVDKGKPASVVTNEGYKITCDHVVSCSHFPFYDGGGFYFARLHAERSYVLGITTGADYPGGMYISAEAPKRSIRLATVNGERLILIGGESHKTGQGICTMQHYEALQYFAEEHFALKEIRYRWSAQDLVTLDKFPYIGKTGSDDRNIWIATGYKKWGMTTGTAAALLLEKEITGKGSPYRELFKPARFHADPDLKTFIVQNADVAKHLVEGKLEMVHRTPQELEPDEGAVVRVNGKRAGAYRDQHGRLHMVDTTCTHMGCEVEWNQGERSWDCPCHGSRFSYKGDVLEGPAKKPLQTVVESS